MRGFGDWQRWNISIQNSTWVLPPLTKSRTVYQTLIRKLSLLRLGLKECARSWSSVGRLRAFYAASALTVTLPIVKNILEHKLQTLFINSNTATNTLPILMTEMCSIRYSVTCNVPLFVTLPNYSTRENLLDLRVTPWQISNINH